MVEQPQVSVLMPVAAARDYLASAIESVLTQTWPSLELILIDDSGQLDDLNSRLPKNDQRARAIACKGKGIADALNTGIGAARGQFICRVDCDDLIPPDRFARQISWLVEHPDFAAVCGSMSTMTHAGRFVSDVNIAHARGEITEELRSGTTRASLCTFLMRAEAVTKTGPFRKYFVTAEDIDFQFRFAELFRVWYESMLTYWYRLHDDSITHSQANVARIFFHKTAREFQSQRLKTGQDDLMRGTPPAPPVETSPPFNSASAVQNLLVGASWEKHRKGRKLAAMRLGWRACLSRPGSLHAWRNLAVLALKRAGSQTSDSAAVTPPPSGA